MWTLEERDAVIRLVTSRGPLRSALKVFCRERAAARRADCAQAMLSYPREYEQASDYAAKAEAYAQFLADLERECQ